VYKTVDELKNLLGKGFLQKSDIVHLMTLYRVQLEGEKIQREYPYLNLYSTWIVHPELTRSLICLKVLVDLTSIICVPDPIAQKVKGVPWTYHFHFRVNKALGLLQLRKDIIEIESKFGLPKTKIPEDKVWRDFVLILISCIYERPIRLPEETKRDKLTKKIYDSIQELSGNDPKKEIIEIVFLPREEAALLSNNRINLPNNLEIYWRLKTSIGSFILGPLQIL